MKRRILSFIVAVAAIQCVNADTVSWANVGTSCFRTNTYGKGEYPNLTRIVMMMHPDSVNCYVTNPEDFKATLNGESVTPVLLNKDSDGNAKEFHFMLTNIREGDNIFSYQRRVRYVNNVDAPGETRYTLSKSETANITIKISPITTLESADQIKDAAFSSHSEIIRYLNDRGPGEYDFLLGRYGFDLNERYNRFYRDLQTPITPYVVDEDGRVVEYCTNLKATNLYQDEDVSFSVSIDKPVTKPGKYWIVFPTSGNFRYLMASGSSNNSHHFSNIKIGPYIVREKSEGSEPATAVPVVVWDSPEVFTSDHRPDSIYLRVTNAGTLSCHNNGEATNSYGTTVSHNDNPVVVTKMVSNGSDAVSIPLPAGWYTGEGDYTLSIADPSKIFEAYTPDGDMMDFSDINLELNFTVNAPTLPGSLDFYVRSDEPSYYAIGRDETLNVRLMHADQALGMKIYVRWTPVLLSRAAVADDEDGFVEHQGDVTISSAGRLDYYTTRGDVMSEVKSIQFVGSDDVSTGVDTARFYAIPVQEGIYDLKGIRVENASSPGLYIQRFSDGSVQKIIVR